MFGVLPLELKNLPLSEFQVLLRYYMKSRKEMEDLEDQNSGGPH